MLLKVCLPLTDSACLFIVMDFQLILIVSIEVVLLFNPDVGMQCRKCRQVRPVRGTGRTLAGRFPRGMLVPI